MDLISEEKLLLLELQTLMNETMMRCDSVIDDDDHPQRRTFALAQVAVTRSLSIYLVENDEWEDFGGVLEATLENEESRYFEACNADDRQLMTITLANRRLLKRLMRRLTDPRRRQLLLSRIESQR